MRPADTPPTRARWPLLHRLLLFAVVLFVCGELAVRVLDWRAGRDASFYLPPILFKDGMYLSHPFMGVVLKPGFSRQGQYSYHINALGMRGKEMAAAKPPGVYRIFCLGGSTTFGTGATSDDKTCPAQLERFLNRLAPEGHAPEGRRYEVGNCGVSGWTSVENLINLQLRLVEYDPDAILIYDGINDGRMIQPGRLPSGLLARPLQPEHRDPLAPRALPGGPRASLRVDRARRAS